MAKLTGFRGKEIRRNGRENQRKSDQSRRKRIDETLFVLLSF